MRMVHCWRSRRLKDSGNCTASSFSSSTQMPILTGNKHNEFFLHTSPIMRFGLNNIGPGHFKELSESLFTTGLFENVQFKPSERAVSEMFR